MTSRRTPTFGPKKLILWLSPIFALIFITLVFWCGFTFTFQQAALLVKIKYYFALTERLKQVGTPSPIEFTLFDFTVRTAEPVQDGVLVYLTAGDAPGMRPQLECIMHLRPQWLLWQLYDHGCSAGSPVTNSAKLYVSGYGPEQREVAYTYVFGFVNDPKAKRVIAFFENGSQREVPIRAQAFVAAVPGLSRFLKVESLDDNGHIIASWEPPIIDSQGSVDPVVKINPAEIEMKMSAILRSA